MKKIYLKKWVEVVIVFIQVILFMILGSECDDLKIFIVSKLIALIIFVINMETIKISLNKPIYNYTGINIDWNKSSEYDGVLTLVSSDSVAKTISAGDYIVLSRSVTDERYNSDYKINGGLKTYTVVAQQRLMVLSAETTSANTIEISVMPPQNETAFVNEFYHQTGETGFNVARCDSEHHLFYQDIDFAISQFIKINPNIKIITSIV